MAVEYDKTGRFQVDYQAPFGGEDSSAYSTAINPKNFALTSSAINESNYLKPLAPKLIASSSVLEGSFLGFIPVTYGTTVGFIITTATIYRIAIIAGGLTFTAAASYTPASSSIGNGEFSYLVIDQIQTAQPQIYWTQNSWNEIWTYNGSAASLLTNYIGGGYLGLLDNQMLNLGGVSQADGSVPNRISWSAPGQYGQWQPYDVGSGTGNYAAGFNDLPSVDDVLTGFFAIGTVGYIIRNQGITQMNPTGNGIEPFTFNHLWASELGVGSSLPDSITQYGPTGLFIGNSAVYSLGLSGLSEVGQIDKTAIFKLINKTFNNNTGTAIQGRIVPYAWQDPQITYILGVPYGSIGVNTNSWVFKGIDYLTSNVYDFGSIPAGNWGDANYLGNCQIGLFSPFNYLPGDLSNTGIIPLVILSNGSNLVNFYIFTPTDATGTLTFKKEQMKFGYWPTVTKVGVLAALIDITTNGTISISVDGGLTFNTAFPDIVITPGGTNENGSPAGTTDPGNGIIGTIFSDGEQSLERPQLVIKLTNVQIAEAWYQGTLADYPVI